MFVFDTMPPIYLAWAFLAPLLLLMVVRRLWNKGLHNYNSASS